MGFAAYLGCHDRLRERATAEECLPRSLFAFILKRLAFSVKAKPCGNRKSVFASPQLMV